MAKEIAALFDFDGTLYTGHIWQDVARHHWDAGQHRRWVAAYMARNMAPLPLYKLGLLSQTTYYRLWGETMGWMLRGWTEQEGLDFFERMTDASILANLRAGMMDRLRQHQAQGHVVALVSGTFAPWLEVIAQRLDVRHAIGTPMEMRDGRFTGRIVPPLCQGQGKSIRSRSYLADRGLDVDWKASYAYGDSGPDVLLLGEVGHPVAVYPDKTLLAHAQTQGWPVVGEVAK